MVILVLAIIAVVAWLFVLFINKYEERKERVFSDILNGDTAIELFNKGVYKEYLVTFKNKKEQTETYPVWAHSEEQAKVMFLAETGESYLRITQITVND